MAQALTFKVMKAQPLLSLLVQKVIHFLAQSFEIGLEESDDNSTFTDVAQAGIVDGTIAADGVFLKIDGTGDAGTGGNPDTTGATYRVGYVGGKRYIRTTIAKTGTHSTGTPLGTTVIKGNARHTGDNAFTAHNA